MTFAIHASDGHITQTLRIDPEVAVAKARDLLGRGLGSAYRGPGEPAISPRGIRPPLRV